MYVFYERKRLKKGVEVVFVNCIIQKSYLHYKVLPHDIGKALLRL